MRKIKDDLDDGVLPTKTQIQAKKYLQEMRDDN
jgi:hypothetical protein